MPPILTPDQIADAVVDEQFGFCSPESAALHRLLIAVDPQSVRLAALYRERLDALMATWRGPEALYDELGMGGR